MIRKLVLILTTGIFLLQLGASGLPHSHENDLNHSTHQDCPLYQLSRSLLATNVALAVGILFAFIFIELISRKLIRFFKKEKEYFECRGQPLVLLNKVKV